MNDQTEHVPRSREEPGASHFLRISVRAWLAIALIGAVILHSVAVMAVVIIFASHGRIEPKDAIALLAVTEPLYTMSGMALAYYFGQQKPQSKAG